MIQFREATVEDDEKLTRLVGKPMPGDLSLSMTREPSLLESCARHGPPRRVLTAVDEEQTLAVCTYFPWNYYVRGKVRQVWTVADFRAERRAASKSVTGLGWRAMRERLDGQPALISLVEDNPLSYRLFSKQRKWWPELRKVAALKTFLLPLALIPSHRTRGGLFQPSPEQIVRALNRQETHLTPVFSTPDVGKVTPGPERFVACNDGCSITACGALWDASEHRQIKVSGYSGLYAKLRSAGRRLRLPVLPEPGHEVRVRFAAFMRGPCKAARRLVLQELVTRAKQEGAQFLVLGQDADDVCPVPAYWPRFTMRSSLFQLKWGGEFELGVGRTGYEVAWL